MPLSFSMPFIAALAGMIGRSIMLTSLSLIEMPTQYAEQLFVGQEPWLESPRTRPLDASRMGAVEDPKHRSAVMRAVKSEDTGPERILRKLLHAIALGYRLHRRDLPGKPDIVYG